MTLIHNRTAGEADHDRRELSAKIRAAGFAVSYHDAKQCDIAAVVAKPADLIAVAGGDGTVRKVALAARADGPPIAVVPLGTANNIANSLGLTVPLVDLIAGWREPRLMNFYPIEVDAPWGRQRLIEGIGFGAFARIIDEETGDEKLSPLEARRQLADAVLHTEPEPLNIRVDDAVASDDIVLLEITTIPLVGPNLYLAPDANPADRLLDVCSVPARERTTLAAWLASPEPGEAAPFATRSASHVAISGRFARVRIDDDVRSNDSGEAGTINLTSAAAPLRFVVPSD
ncbi:MAG: NAD(+)/NADH kinase [Alphaproteobacteria bacterium]|nr:NAD(+)/NADH kinase [Alphaproteobacteria bacterium]